MIYVLYNMYASPYILYNMIHLCHYMRVQCIKRNIAGLLAEVSPPLLEVPYSGSSIHTCYKSFINNCNQIKNFATPVRNSRLFTFLVCPKIAFSDNCH